MPVKILTPSQKEKRAQKKLRRAEAAFNNPKAAVEIEESLPRDPCEVKRELDQLLARVRHDRAHPKMMAVGRRAQLRGMGLNLGDLYKEPEQDNTGRGGSHGDR